MHKGSRIHTSNTSAARVIQLSTLERAHRVRPAYRYVPRSTSIASMVSRVQIVASRSFAGIMIVVMTLFYPAGAFANEAAPTETTATPETTETQPVATDSPAPEPQPEPQPSVQSAPSTSTTSQPLAASEPQTSQEAQGYAYDEKSGTWEKNNTDPEYTYNPDTGCWETVSLMCDPTTGRYVPRPKPKPVDNSSSTLSSGGSQDVGLSSGVGVGNDIYSFANSGDALVSGNTLAGDALSGDALAIANIINMLNSSVGLTDGGKIATFSSDIYGDVFGDLYIDPSVLAVTQPASSIDGENANLQVNAELDSKIENNVVLDARSGDATVSRNTQAGSATSGSADAVANIINMLNAAISTGSSFLGVLNIYGSLNGDILLPEGLLQTLLASNGAGGPDSTSTTVNLNDSQTIANNINASAQSGDATVARNTSAGDATTGNGQTNVTILNLTGRNVVAANSLLVFVNVLGTWVGVIMDAPAGSTSAALGTGVTQDSQYTNADYNVDTSSEITNNVDVRARSGDVMVMENTVAGSATSGDATASVNLANIINSSFSLADWFGVLFINVFGTWNGSFGVDTAAGERPGTPTGGDTSAAGAKPKPKVFRFVPNKQGGTTLASVDMNNETSAAAVEKAVKAVSQKLSKESQKPNVTEEIQPVGGQESQSAAQAQDYLLPVVGFVIGGTLLGGERVVSYRQRRKLSM